MGLDMYLERSRKTDKYTLDELRNIVDSGNKDEIDKLLDDGLLFRAGHDDYAYIDVTEEVGYWRKANAIHRWFVEECQGGVDECQRAEVSEEQLRALLELCRQVKKTPSLAGCLLPTQRGFFFGGMLYDDWYWDDLDETIKLLTKVLKETNFATHRITYQSSW